jgi:hypothetical protein
MGFTTSRHAPSDDMLRMMQLMPPPRLNAIVPSFKAVRRAVCLRSTIASFVPLLVLIDASRERSTLRGPTGG